MTWLFSKRAATTEFTFRMWRTVGDPYWKGVEFRFNIYSDTNQQKMETTVTHGSGVPISREAQLAWMQSLRPDAAHIELVFNEGDDGHPLIAHVAHLQSSRTVGVGPGNGYARPRWAAVRRRYAYSRDIIRALHDLGGFFPNAGSTEHWTALGDVDVVFLDKQGKLLGATVTHEGIIITPSHD